MLNNISLKGFLFTLILFVISTTLWAQSELAPVYQGCEEVSTEELEECFYNSFSNDFYTYFQNDIVKDSTNFYVLFLAKKTGDYEVLSVSSSASDIKNEVNRVFSQLPPFKPATYDGRAIDKQYIIYYPKPTDSTNVDLGDKLVAFDETHKESEENLLESTLRVPEGQFIKIPLKEGTHTAVKPYIYLHHINKEDYLNTFQSLLKDSKMIWEKKVWNEHLIEIKGENYWFHLDPIVDFQMGKDNSDINYTFTNTRAVQLEGSLWKKLSFATSFYESQGRFAKYFNDYAYSIKAEGNEPAIVPGRGLDKDLSMNAFDYPEVSSYISYSPNETFNFQFGRDKNFIGDGYRSLFLSDNSSNYSFFKISSKFWKFQYTNLWMWLRDVRPEATVNNLYKRKFAAMHHLSWNVTKKLNIGLFESVIWADNGNHGFDMDYFNPIILYHVVEFGMGSGAGNVLLGMNTKYNINPDIDLYGQIILDEITISEYLKSDGYWANKYGLQLGMKYRNAFKVNNLNLLAEFNTVRPYTYSHDDVEFNYGHYNQSLAHPWGSNFDEIVLKADYQKDRWFGELKNVYGAKGFDLDGANYGGDVYRDNSERIDTYGIHTLQGNKAKIYIGELTGGYLINPSTNLKLFGRFLVRSFNAEQPDDLFKNGTTTWFSLGLSSDLRRWYFDF